MREMDFMKGEAQNYETIRGTEKKKRKAHIQESINIFCSTQKATSPEEMRL